jgi:hypothetical protein
MLSFFRSSGKTHFTYCSSSHRFFDGMGAEADANDMTHSQFFGLGGKPLLRELCTVHEQYSAIPHKSHNLMNSLIDMMTLPISLHL